MATRQSPDDAARGTGAGGRGGKQKDPRRAKTCEYRRAENTLDHGLMASAVAVHMGLPPPEVSSADARVKRATLRSRMNVRPASVGLSSARECARELRLATPPIFCAGHGRASARPGRWDARIAPTVQQKTVGATSAPNLKIHASRHARDGRPGATLDARASPMLGGAFRADRGRCGFSSSVHARRRKTPRARRARA